MTDAEISAIVDEMFDMRPASIEREFKLRNPIYLETATYGHLGRTPRTVKKTFIGDDGQMHEREVELFTWEKLDRVDDIKRRFNL